MTGPDPALLDPLADWPHVDPRPDRIAEVIADLRGRAASWAAVEHAAAAAIDAVSAAAGAAAAAERTALGALADAATALATALLVVATALDGYLAAYDAYRARLGAAHELARAAIADSLAHRDPRGSTVVWDSPLRHDAWDTANRALAAFSAAGQEAALTVADQASRLGGHWVDLARACVPAPTPVQVADYGRTLRSIPGGIDAILAGTEFAVAAAGGPVTVDTARLLVARAANVDSAVALVDGRYDDVTGATGFAVSVADAHGANPRLIAGLGRLALLADVGAGLAFDAQTAFVGAGEQGAHDVLSRGVATVNGAALAGAGVRLVAADAVDGLLAGPAIPIALAATTAYQLGDFVYAHRKGIVAEAGALVGHRTAVELP